MKTYKLWHCTCMCKEVLQWGKSIWERCFEKFCRGIVPEDRPVDWLSQHSPPSRAWSLNSSSLLMFSAAGFPTHLCFSSVFYEGDISGWFELECLPTGSFASATVSPTPARGSSVLCPRTSSWCPHKNSHSPQLQTIITLFSWLHTQPLSSDGRGTPNSLTPWVGSVHRNQACSSLVVWLYHQLRNHIILNSKEWIAAFPLSWKSSRAALFNSVATGHMSLSST